MWKMDSIDGKTVLVEIIPECISINREEQHAYHAVWVYQNDRHNPKITVVETDSDIRITYHR